MEPIGDQWGHYLVGSLWEAPVRMRLPVSVDFYGALEEVVEKFLLDDLAYIVFVARRTLK